MIAPEQRRGRSFEGSCNGAGKATLLIGAHGIEHNDAVALANDLAVN
jgi:hypothetical protein